MWGFRQATLLLLHTRPRWRLHATTCCTCIHSTDFFRVTGLAADSARWPQPVDLTSRISGSSRLALWWWQHELCPRCMLGASLPCSAWPLRWCLGASGRQALFSWPRPPRLGCCVLQLPYGIFPPALLQSRALDYAAMEAGPSDSSPSALAPASSLAPAAARPPALCSSGRWTMRR